MGNERRHNPEYFIFKDSDLPQEFRNIEFDIVHCTPTHAILEIKSHIPVFFQRLKVNGDVHLSHGAPLYNHPDALRLRYEARDGDEVEVTLGNIYGFSSTKKESGATPLKHT